jgi:hypothetical protein
MDIHYSMPISRENREFRWPVSVGVHDICVDKAGAQNRHLRFEPTALQF